MLRIFFWILFCLETAPVAFAALAAVLGVLTGKYSLNSMMLLIAPAGFLTVLLACIGAWFYFTESKIAFAFLLLPFALIPFLLVTNLATDKFDKDLANGNLDFKQPGKKRLANAIAANDTAAAISAIPAAGDLNQAGENGIPILNFAMQRQKPDTAIIAALLNAGANPNLAATDGTLPLELTQDYDIIKSLVDHGADPNKKGRHEPVWFHAFGDMYGTVYKGEKIFDLYLEHGLKLEGVNSRGRVPLAAAAEGSNWHAVRIMLERGLDPNGVMIHTTPLYDRLQMAATVGASRPNPDLEAAMKMIRAKATASK